MATMDNLRNGLIHKIKTINDKGYLEALDHLLSAGSQSLDAVKLTQEQKAMLELSEDDIENGRLISQEAMDKRNLEWLQGL